MSKSRKLSRKVDVLRAIASTIAQQQAKQLPSVEGSLDPKIRASLAPDEEADWGQYNQSFRIIKKALDGNIKATAALFELDSRLGALLNAQASVSRAVGASARWLMAIVPGAERPRS